jgi:hypothetical protein
VPEEVVTTSELLDLLATSIRCAERVRENLRFDFYNSQQKVCIGLFQAVIEYAKAVHEIVLRRLFYAPTALHRAALEAYVDIVNASEDRGYCEHLEAADSLSWKRLLERASAESNPLLKEIAEAEFFETARRMHSERVRQLEKKGVKKLEPAERFQLAGMTDEYEAAYAMLSAEAHNNVSFITNHYFDVRAEPPMLRIPGSRPTSGAPVAVTLNMAEIALSSTDRVLCLCGHGTAVLASTRRELERIHTKLLAAHR